MVYNVMTEIIESVLQHALSESTYGSGSGHSYFLNPVRLRPKAQMSTVVTMISAAIAQMDIATSNRYIRESPDSVAVHIGRRRQTRRGCSRFGEHIQRQADAKVC